METNLKKIVSNNLTTPQITFLKEINKKLLLKVKTQCGVAAAECIKECFIAETAIVAGEKENINKAMKLAHLKLNTAAKYALISNNLGTTKTNSADTAVTIARKQFNMTSENLKNSRKRITINLNPTAKNNHGIGLVH